MTWLTGPVNVGGSRATKHRLKGVRQIMADISMCLGNGCALRGKCYRYRAVSEGEFQSYMNFDKTPVGTEDDCQYFWPIEKAEGPIVG
jgi:hypothetical protein